MPSKQSRLVLALLASVACSEGKSRFEYDAVRDETPDAATNAADEPNDPVAPDGVADAAPPAGPSTQIEYDGLNGMVRNPIISHVFTADPSANVFNGRIYLYASHDLDEQEGYSMFDYHVFSSNDLVNWQDHGVVLDAHYIPWASHLYAPDAAYGAAPDQYFLYYPNGGTNIGVAVSEDPGGPFEDVLGGPLVQRSTPGVEEVNWIFDPTCFVDDDGQAYLYFGGGFGGTGDNARVIRLGEDMVSLKDESATTIIAPDFFEAAFVHRRDDTYYFSYSTTFDSGTANIDYLMSDDPMTGFEYAGTVMKNPDGNFNQNHHHSIIEFEGSWYIFYHNRVLSRRDGYGDYQRSVTLSRLEYESDGSIAEVPAMFGAIEQLRNLDAFSRLEAETIADQRGVETTAIEEGDARVGVAVTDIHDEDWIGYSQVDFGDGVTRFVARVSTSNASDGSIEVYVDGSDLFSNLPGEHLGSCRVNGTEGEWVDIECDIAAVDGVHDLYLRFSGSSETTLFELDWFRFE